MKQLYDELLGLFVEDVRFAAGLIFWLLTAYIANGCVQNSWILSALFVSGLSLILLESVARYARHIGRNKIS